MKMKKARVKIKNEKMSVSIIIDNLSEFLIPILSYASGVAVFSIVLMFVHLNNIQFYYYIDEMFHIPQAVRYCEGKFFEWDSKITTLPGLYLFSAFILGPINLCTITFLRAISVLCTYLNLFLTWKIINIIHKKSRNALDKKLSNYILYLTAWNIAFFPVLFFYFFLYYTDTFSVSLVLLMYLLHKHNRNKTAAFVGALSIISRQTNVIWVAFVGIERGLTVIEELTKKPQLIDTYNLIPCVKSLYRIFRVKFKEGIMPFSKFITSVCEPFLVYLLVLLLFMIFVVYNNGIVVGDRTNHLATVHITQLFYFSAFVFGFSWPYLIPYSFEFLKYIQKNLIRSLVFMSFITCVVHFNTLVHPFTLADNRHYSFYIWKNFMNRFIFFKYLLVPVYAFAIFAIFKSLSHQRVLSIVAYSICVSAVLVPQLLLEARYFIIPYILFRIYQKEAKNWQIVAETLTVSAINIIQFVIFVNKSFYWPNEKYPQRIGW